jgi:tetratricopeptide (TPR) repeat protein
MSQFLTQIRAAFHYESEKEFTKAFNLFANCEKLSKQPTVVIKIKARMAWCQHSVGNIIQTDAIFSEIRSSFTNEPLSFLVHSKYLIKLKKYKSAKELLKEGIIRFPAYLEFYLVLASLLKDMERAGESIEILKSALDQEVLTKGRGIDRKDIWAELGSLYFKRGDFNSSLACLKKSLALCNSSDFLHYDLLANCYLEVDDTENAIRSLEAFIQYRGEVDAETLILLARAECRQGLIDEASRHLILAYSFHDSLYLKGNDMTDFAPLLRNGFFTTLENVELEDQ